MNLEQLYLALCERVSSQKEVFTDGPIAHQDVYYGQDLDALAEAQGEVFPTPALFYDFQFEYSDTGQLAQQAAGMVRIYLVQEQYGRSAEGSPDQHKGLAFLRREQQVHLALHGYSVPGGGRLMRRLRSFTPDLSNVKVTVIEFYLTYSDDEAATGSGLVETAADGEIDLSKGLVKKIPATERVSRYKLD